METSKSRDLDRTNLVAAERPMRMVGGGHVAADPFESIGNEIAGVMKRTHDAVVALRAEARAEVDRGRVEAGQLIIDVRTEAERIASQLCREAEAYARTVRAEADRYAIEVRREADVLAQQQAVLHKQLLDYRAGLFPRPAAPVAAAPRPAPAAAPSSPPVSVDRQSRPAEAPASAEDGKAPFFAALFDESGPQPGTQD